MRHICQRNNPHYSLLFTPKAHTLRFVFYPVSLQNGYALQIFIK